MEQQLTNELLRILPAVRIVGPDSLLFAGKVASPSIEQQSQDARMLMTQHLTGLLYLQCYCRSFTGEIDHRTILSVAEPVFVKQLSDANNSREHLNAGWRVLR